MQVKKEHIQIETKQGRTDITTYNFCQKPNYSSLNFEQA